MEIRVLDFEVITKHYLNYQEGLKKIGEKKQEYIDRLTPMKKEMEDIFKRAQSGIVVDKVTEQARMERFQQIQQEAVEIDQEFQSVMKEMRGALNEKSYDELEEIVNEWATENSIDLVTGKMEVIFSNPKYDSTDDILEVLKKKDLFTEQEETEKESV